jgi:hypothetical protein
MGDLEAVEGIPGPRAFSRRETGSPRGRRRHPGTPRVQSERNREPARPSKTSRDPARSMGDLEAVEDIPGTREAVEGIPGTRAFNRRETGSPRGPRGRRRHPGNPRGRRRHPGNPRVQPKSSGNQRVQAERYREPSRPRRKSETAREARAFNRRKTGKPSRPAESMDPFVVRFAAEACPRGPLGKLACVSRAFKEACLEEAARRAGGRSRGAPGSGCPRCP